jgi:hypothetical protein
LVAKEAINAEDQAGVAGGGSRLTLLNCQNCSAGRRATLSMTLYIPPMDNVELMIVSALFGVLILWFGVYLWRQIRNR